MLQSATKCVKRCLFSHRMAKITQLSLVFMYNLGHNIEANGAKLYFHQLAQC